MKEDKKNLLSRIKKLYKKGGSVSSSALVLALQKVDSDSLVIEKDGVYSADGSELIYSRGKQEEVTVPAAVKTIGDMAFARKKKLKRIFLPSGLQTIGEEAFADCDNLTEVTIPASVETIRLRRVVFLGMPKKISRKAFESCDELHDIVIADDNVKAMRKALHVVDGDINYLVVGREEKEK